MRVRVREEAVGEIGAGPCVLLGVARGDGPTEASRLAGKVARLRIFEDEQGRFDRFGRDQIEGCLALRCLTLCGARLLGVEDGFDFRSPGSKMLFQMRMMVAEDYLDRVRDGWATARKRATERGVLSARTPYGYSRGEDGRLLPNEQAGVVQMIFRLKAEGKPLSAIRENLNGTPSTPVWPCLKSKKATPTTRAFAQVRTPWRAAAICFRR